jgi:hypothetical protein
MPRRNISQSLTKNIEITKGYVDELFIIVFNMLLVRPVGKFEWVVQKADLVVVVAVFPVDKK